MAACSVVSAEQIPFLLGHVSAQTTEHLGCKQRLHDAVNDRIGIEPGNEVLTVHTIGQLDEKRLIGGRDSLASWE
jgi:hypothetical protein